MILTLDNALHFIAAAALTAIAIFAMRLLAGGPSPAEWVVPPIVTLIFVAREAEQAEAEGRRQVPPVRGDRWRPWKWGKHKHFEWIAALVGALIGALIVALVLALAPRPAQAADPRPGQEPVPICASRAEIAAALYRNYRERPAAISIAGNGSLIELYLSPGGATWTLIEILPMRATACLRYSGEGWTATPQGEPS